MKSMLSAFALITLAAFGNTGQSRPSGPEPQAPAAGKSPTKVANYYPLKVGTKWHYQIDPGNGQVVRLTGQVGGVEPVDGKTLVRLEFFSDGQKLPATEHLQSDDHGVFRVRMNGVEVSPPLCLIKYPLKQGQTWESEMMTGNGPKAKVEGSQGGPEDVEVPAGKYRAIPCTIVVTAGTTRYTNVFWFAEDVGIVKQRSELGPQTVLMELTKFEAPK